MTFEESQRKKVQQLETLEKDFCHGLGVSKVCKFLSKKSVENPLARIFFYALKAELCSVLAKKALFQEHKKKKSKTLYRGKHDALMRLIELLYKRNFPDYSADNYGRVCYGYQRDEKGCIVVFFNLPGCEQISFHNGFEKDFIDRMIPIYLYKWDHQQTTTLTKLEDAICRHFWKELGISEESLTKKQANESSYVPSERSFENIDKLYSQKESIWKELHLKKKYLENQICGIGLNVLRSILSGVGDSTGDDIAYLCGRILSYEQDRLENACSISKESYRQLRNNMLKCSEQIPRLVERIRSASDDVPVSQIFVSQNSTAGESWKNCITIDGLTIVFLVKREKILKKFSGTCVAVKGDVPGSSVDNNIENLETIINNRYKQKIDAVNKYFETTHEATQQ